MFSGVGTSECQRGEQRKSRVVVKVLAGAVGNPGSIFCSATDFLCSLSQVPQWLCSVVFHLDPGSDSNASPYELCMEKYIPDPVRI